MREGSVAWAVERTRPLAFLLTALAASAATWVWVGLDQPHDVDSTLATLPWAAIAVVLLLPALAVTHFACAGYALQSVSGRALNSRETTLVQLAAAATNRLVPNGVAGAALNVRYLMRAGIEPGAAATALGALALIGGATDGLFVGAITTVGPFFGLPGAAGELRSVTRPDIGAGHQYGWLVAAVAAGLALCLVVRMRGKLVYAVRHGLVHLRRLLRTPRRLTGASVASMATTAVLAVGFVLAVTVWGQSPAPMRPAALIALYGIGAAAGNATPLPPLFGATEAALTAGLVLGGYSSASAVTAVVIFRGITYWAPVPVGVWAARRLHRAALL